MSKTLYNPAENQHGLFPRCHPPIKQQNISISSFQHVFDYIDLYHYHPIHPLPDRVPVWFMFVFRIMVTLVTFEAACIQGSDTRSTTVSWSPQITTPKFAWNLDDWMPPTVTKPNCLSKSLQKKKCRSTESEILWSLSSILHFWNFCRFSNTLSITSKSIHEQQKSPS